MASVAIGVVLGATLTRVVAGWSRRRRRLLRRRAGSTVAKAERAVETEAEAEDAADGSAVGEDGESDESDESGDDSGPHKMVLVVRTDLKMTKGKIAAQCCHGAIGAYQLAAEVSPDALRRWERSGCAKVALQVATDAELLAVYRAARQHRLPHYLVVDAGRTQIEAGSKTVCAVGPGPVAAIDAVTGGLRLL